MRPPKGKGKPPIRFLFRSTTSCREAALYLHDLEERGDRIVRQPRISKLAAALRGAGWMEEP